jgi:SAM-dependent methyltransferase
MEQTLSAPHACPVCGATERAKLFRTRDRHYRIAGEWDVARCTGCGMVQLDPMPSTAELMGLYPTDFYAYADLSAKNRGLMARIKHALFPTMYVNDPVFARPGRVIDSGCGTGWSLIKFRDQGWECVGVEPSDSAAKFGREHFKLDVRTGTVLSERLPAGQFDYIRSNHSLEHDPDADATLAEFRRLIRDDGTLLIGVPNIDSLPARWFGKYWWYLGAPVHTYNFSTRHLTRMLEKHGFAVRSVRYAGNFGGLNGSLQIYLNRNRPDRVSTDGWLVNNMIAKVIGQLLAMPLNLLRQGDAIEIVAAPVTRTGAAGGAR